MIAQKLKYYKTQPSTTDIEKAIESKRLLWAKEMKPLITEVYDFDDAKTTLLSALSNIDLV